MRNMSSVMQTSQDLLASFRKAYAKDGDVLMDGPVCWEEWLCQPVKILFYYKETYGYSDSVPNLNAIKHADWFSNEYAYWARGNRTIQKILGLAWAIFEQMDGKKVNPEKIRVACDDETMRINTMRRVAHVNIKKVSGRKSASNDAEIARYSRRMDCAELLREQFILCRPDIIICGGTVCWTSAIENFKVFQGIRHGQKPCADVHNGRVLCHFNHVGRQSYDTLNEYSRRVAVAWNRRCSGATAKAI